VTKRTRSIGERFCEAPELARARGALACQQTTGLATTSTDIERGRSCDPTCTLLEQQAWSALEAPGVTELDAECPDSADAEHGNVPRLDHDPVLAANVQLAMMLSATDSAGGTLRESDTPPYLVWHARRHAQAPFILRP
jgi:hypothetical protein